MSPILAKNRDGGSIIPLNFLVYWVCDVVLKVFVWSSSGKALKELWVNATTSVIYEVLGLTVTETVWVDEASSNFCGGLEILRDCLEQRGEFINDH